MPQYTNRNEFELASTLNDDEVIVTYGDLPRFGIKFCRVHLNRLIAAGVFPAPVRLSINRIGWRRSEVREFLRTRQAIVPAEPKRHSDAARQKMKDAWVVRRAARAGALAMVLLLDPAPTLDCLTQQGDLIPRPTLDERAHSIGVKLDKSDNFWLSAVAEAQEVLTVDFAGDRKVSPLVRYQYRPWRRETPPRMETDGGLPQLHPDSAWSVPIVRNQSRRHSAASKRNGHAKVGMRLPTQIVHTRVRRRGDALRQMGQNRIMSPTCRCWKSRSSREMDGSAPPWRPSLQRQLRQNTDILRSAGSNGQ